MSTTAAAAPQFVTAPPAPKSKSLTEGLVIILLTLGMLFLVNRVKSLDLRLRNTEHLVRDLVIGGRWPGARLYGTEAPATKGKR